MLICMRTTLNLSDALAAEAKSAAAAAGLTFTSYIEDALREHLKHQTIASSTVALPTFGLPGAGALLVDIDDKDALWDALDGAA